MENQTGIKNFNLQKYNIFTQLDKQANNLTDYMIHTNLTINLT